MPIKLAKKYILVVPKDKEIKARLLKCLENNGNVEIAKAGQEEIRQELREKMSGLNYLISSAEFAIAQLTAYEAKIPFWQKLKQPKISIKKQEKERFKRNIFLENLVKRLVQIEKEKETLKAEQKEIQAKIQEIDKFKALDFLPIATKYFQALLASLSQASFPSLEALAKKHILYFKEIQKSSGKIIALLIVLKEDKEKISEKIKQLKGEIITYQYSELPKKILSDLQQKKKEIESQQALLTKELQDKAKFLNELKIYHDLLCVCKAEMQIEQKAREGRFMDYLAFYTLEDNKKTLLKKLKKLSPEISIMATKESKENLPVVLQNHKITRPFQYITEIFGLPRATEIDPTPFLALFFIIFFGICLTDAGYGLFLVIASLLALILLKKRLGDSKLIKLLFYGGISTMIMGILFGSYFGLTAEQIKFLPFLKDIRRIDPVKDTLLFMAICFALGYLQILFSQCVRIISGIKNKNRQLIETGASWALLYIFGGLALAGLKFPGLKNIGMWGAIAGAGAIMFFEAKSTPLLLKPLVGFVKLLQGLINTTSDVLSYSRLMALGLATGIIALIINQIALIFKELIPVVGWAVGAGVLVAGHIFNLGINALSGFIHSGRLQFVEFFPKFLEGGGRRFKPIKPKLKYIEFI